MDKLILLRDIEKYDWETQTIINTPIVDQKSNITQASIFLKDIIKAAGFEPRQKVDILSEEVKVYIKGFAGGKFYLKCMSSYEFAGGDEDMDAIEVNEFHLGCDHEYCILNEDEKMYKSKRDIIENLAKDLNLYAGSCVLLRKNES